jgi:hypothetical protein
MFTRNARAAGWIAIAVSVGAIASVPDAVALTQGGDPVPGTPQVVVVDAPPAARELAAWAVGRFEAAGLELPPTEVHFHGDTDGCRGFLGYAQGGRIDLCVRLAMEAGPQRLVLHELAHAWEGVTLDDACRDRFLALRGLDAWAGTDAEWKQRGIEQLAEIVAWGLADGAMGPMIDGDRDPEALIEAYDLVRQRCVV